MAGLVRAGLRAGLRTLLNSTVPASIMADEAAVNSFSKACRPLMRTVSTASSSGGPAASAPDNSTGSTDASTSQATQQGDYSQSSSSSGYGSGMPRLVVFGGRGFVGSAIVKEAVEQGLDVVAVSRSGTPPVRREPYADMVSWVRGNALEPSTYEQHLQGATAVISTVGAFGSQQEMFRTCGTANITAIEAAAKAGVPRFVFISAQIPNVPGIEYVLGGYVKGKQAAEEALRAHFPAGGVAIRPSVIYGSRVVSSSLALPLHLIFQPVESILSHLPAQRLSQVPVLGAVMTPPVSVAAVARAAVRAATDPSVPAGIIDVWGLQQYK